MQPFTAGRDCGDPAKDLTNDDAPPYAIPLGGGAQIVVMDLAFADEAKAIDLNDPRAALFRSAYPKIDALSRKASFTFLATYKPIPGFSAVEKARQLKLQPRNRSIKAVFASLNPNLLPHRIDTLLAGHYHVWEQVSSASNHPSQFISGTQEDIVPMPESFGPMPPPPPAQSRIISTAGSTASAT